MGQKDLDVKELINDGVLYPYNHESEFNHGMFLEQWKITNGILLLKLFLPTVRKNCSCDREKLLKFEAEGREFANILRSLEQFIQTVKGQNNFW